MIWNPDGEEAKNVLWRFCLEESNDDDEDDDDNFLEFPPNSNNRRLGEVSEKPSLMASPRPTMNIASLVGSLAMETREIGAMQRIL